MKKITITRIEKPLIYEIRADAKKYAEYAVDENGKLTYELHAFEGADLISYKIVRIEDNEMIDDGFDTFEDAKKALSEL